MDYQSQSEATPVVAREHGGRFHLLVQEAEMADESGQDAPAGALKGRAVEQAAVDFVMEYERSNGREPTDRRYERAFAGDIKSPPRVIEIKATATSYRGWFLPLEPIQAEHAANDPDFYVYVVENVGQGDPSQFTLRILAGEHLRRLVSRATERRYFEVPWPTKDYDATTVEPRTGATGIATPAVTPGTMAVTPPPSGMLAASPSGATTHAEAIREALIALGGEANVQAVQQWVGTHYSGRWKDVGVLMADLTLGGNASSGYPPDRRFLERVSPGLYRLRQ